MVREQTAKVVLALVKNTKKEWNLQKEKKQVLVKVDLAVEVNKLLFPRQSKRAFISSFLFTKNPPN